MAESIQNLLDYLDASVSPYHAVAEAEILLKNTGFKKLDEKDSWDIQKGDSCYVTRNNSSILAFRVGDDFDQIPAFRIVTAHTDSPTFRLKEGAIKKKNGMLVLPVEVLGGPIFSTWTDRDLALAGRVLVKTEQGVETVLYRDSGRTVLIPNAPIHLNREVNKGFAYNPQNHLSCIVQSSSDEQINSIYDLISKDLGISADTILDADIILYDTQNAALNGWNQEFLSSGRIDNLAMCHASLEALIESDNISGIALAALFDNEETGSISPHGADSSFLEQVMERILLSKGGSREDFMKSCASSFIISADAAHAIHPNFSELYDEPFTPEMGKGPAIKKNASWNYASTGETSAQYRLLCDKASVPCQVYINRSDRPTGKTLGPITAARLGIPCVDVGSPLWSMHSIRETVSVEDHESMIKSFISHFKEI